MARTLELRKQIRNMLLQICPNVTYEQRPDKINRPCIVFELFELTHNYGKSLYELEVDILDYGKSTQEIEGLADQVQELLNKKKVINHAVQFVIYRGSRHRIEEEDKQILRRRLVFEVQLHELKGE